MPPRHTLRFELQAVDAIAGLTDIALFSTTAGSLHSLPQQSAWKLTHLRYRVAEVIRLVTALDSPLLLNFSRSTWLLCRCTFAVMDRDLTKMWDRPYSTSTNIAEPRLVSSTLVAWHRSRPNAGQIPAHCSGSTFGQYRLRPAQASKRPDKSGDLSYPAPTRYPSAIGLPLFHAHYSIQTFQTFL